MMAKFVEICDEIMKKKSFFSLFELARYLLYLYAPEKIICFSTLIHKRYGEFIMKTKSQLSGKHNSNKFYKIRRKWIW